MLIIMLILAMMRYYYDIISLHVHYCPYCPWWALHADIILLLRLLCCFWWYTLLLHDTLWDPWHTYYITITYIYYYIPYYYDILFDIIILHIIHIYIKIVIPYYIAIIMSYTYDIWCHYYDRSDPYMLLYYMIHIIWPIYYMIWAYY